MKPSSAALIYATWTKENQDQEENEEHNKDQEQSRADDGPLHNYISTNLLWILNETTYYSHVARKRLSSNSCFFQPHARPVSRSEVDPAAPFP